MTFRKYKGIVTVIFITMQVLKKNITYTHLIPRMQLKVVSTLVVEPCGAECFQLPDDDKTEELNFTDGIVLYSFKQLPPLKTGQR